MPSIALPNHESKRGGEGEQKAAILLSPRDALLNKRELDRRETFAEVVADYPQVKNQRKIIFKQFNLEQRKYSQQTNQSSLTKGNSSTTLSQFSSTQAPVKELTSPVQKF